MPFTRVDVDAYDEIAEEIGAAAAGPRPSGGFEYEPARAAFDPAELNPVARATLDSIRAAGGAALRVRYDGGYDEGFAHPDAVHFADGRTAGAASVRRELAAWPGYVAAVRAAAGKDSTWGNAAEMYAKASDADAAGYALDELAGELATRLLGDGFGTGEYQLYGAFTADLATCQIEDDPHAPPPPEGAG
jgi:hypothetical protein